MKRSPESHPHQDIGKRLMAVRNHFGLEQSQMATALGVSGSTYNNWETGLSRLSLDGAKRLREKYSVSLDYIYFGDISALATNLAKVLSDKS
ncbi:helix-turn-helix domain-containing protein [Oceanicella sp. SM1341]|uniref:helix-turn-helix domain-containing protein n=1 Tax=Oceanicella sp. SM1341 TaxID=1548889 RepID=UPI000E532D51|nr:helix-turn-helix transcriptional regulator [Oceanicella sp. SM1341]